MVYYDGEYHLFFQHNPYGTAVGQHDLGPRRQHRPRPLDSNCADAIHPDELGTIFSGSAVVDREQHRRLPDRRRESRSSASTRRPAAPTPNRRAQPFTQSIAYSNDRGRTWTKYDGQSGAGQHPRTATAIPRSFWHAPQQPMGHGSVSRPAATSSPCSARRICRKWTKLCDVPFPNGRECPDFFELPVDGDPANTRWVVLGRPTATTWSAASTADVHSGERPAPVAIRAATTTRPRPTAISRPPTAGGSRSPGWPAASSPACPSTSR